MREDAAMTACRVVSITPLPLEADSRTLKIAKSFARAGFHSVVVEGCASARTDWGEDIKVISLGGRTVAGAAVPPTGAPPPGRGRPGLMKRLVRALRHGQMGVPGELALLGAFLLRFARDYRWRAWSAIPDASVYYLHSYEFYGAVAPLVRRNGARLIYDAHDYYQGIEPEAALPSFDRRFLRPLLFRLERRLIADAACVVTVTDGTAELIERHFGRRPVVLRNGHDPRLEEEPPQGLRARLGLAKDRHLLVVVGNWKRGMMIDQTLDALLLLPDTLHLAFVGRGTEAIQDKIARHPAGARVHSGLVVAPTEVVPFIRSADVGLVIYHDYSENYRFALPNGFFQMVAAHLPVVHPDLREIVAAIGDHRIGPRLESFAPEVIAGAIRTALADAPTFAAEAGALAERLLWVAEDVRLLSLVAKDNRIP